MRCVVFIGCLLSASMAAPVSANPPEAKTKTKAKKPIPPGLAKKGGLPPGLAKKFGPRVPEHPYIAFDPNRTDRAWFLIEGQWQLKTGLTGALKVEIQESLTLPLAPPPVPLPRVGVDLHVVLFD